MRPKGCFVAPLGEMCSKGTVSARDSFVYISEAVLSNHGAAPESNRPENMQCLTVSIIQSFQTLSVLCVRVCACVCLRVPVMLKDAWNARLPLLCVTLAFEWDVWTSAYCNCANFITQWLRVKATP